MAFLRIRGLKRRIDWSDSETETEATSMTEGLMALENKSEAFRYKWTRNMDFEDCSVEEMRMAFDQHLQLCKEEATLKAEKIQSLVEDVESLMQRRKEVGNRFQKRMKVIISHYSKMYKEVNQITEGLKEVKEQLGTLEKDLKEKVHEHVKFEMKTHVATALCSRF